jgi:hypothetical protein
MGVNTWEGVEWLERDRFEALLAWAVRLDAIETGRPVETALVDRLAAAAAAADYRLDRMVATGTPSARRSRPSKPKRTD